MNNQLTYLLLSLQDLVEPIKRDFSSLERLEFLFSRYGYKVQLDESIFGGIQAVSDIATETEEFFNAASVIEDRLESETNSDLQPEEIINLAQSGFQLYSMLTKFDTTNFSTLPPPMNTDDFWKDVADHLLDDLLEKFVRIHYPKLYVFVHLFGIIRYEPTNPEGTARQPYTRTMVDWPQIAEIARNPLHAFKKIYGWGDETTPFKDQQLLSALQKVLKAVGVVAKLGAPPTHTTKNIPPTADYEVDEERAALFVQFLYNLSPYDNAIYEIGVEIYPLVKKPATFPSGLLFKPLLRGGIHKNIPITNEFSIAWAAGADLGAISGLTLFPDAIDWVMGNLIAGSAIEFTYTPSSTICLIGNSKTSRVELSGLSIKLSMEGTLSDGEVKIQISTSSISGKPTQFVLNLGESDGFMQDALKSTSAISVPFDLHLIWSSSGGLKFNGSTNIETTIPILKEIGPVTVTSITVGLRSASNGVSIDTGLGIKGKFGPLTFVVDRIGVSSSLTFFTREQLANLPAGAKKPLFGNVDLDLSFLPPNALGISIDAGGFTGGGFLNFDQEEGEYFGALELEYRDLFSLKAFGIINTKFPDGTKGFSLLIVITAEFSPMQLGFGFTLNGVGGLFGMNRTVRIDALKEGIKTNTLKSILFPENIVANIDRIISDIKLLFPSQNGHFLICPMGKIGWGTPTLITIELGILIEVPGNGFKILGVIKALLPEEKHPLLKLQVNFLGDIDFENKSIAFDAYLFDSSILTFTLTGQMAFRLSFGDNPAFLLSAGGFHPAYKEVPADLKNMQRITISLYDSSNARITIQTYIAVTSNTAQFGAKAELYAEKGSFNIYGFVSYDVLFQFDPFKFIADFGAGVALRRHSSVIMSVHVSGQLSGPKPWDARGEASVSFFFFSVSVPFHVSWGDSNNIAEEQKEDILASLRAAIANNRNWKAELPANRKINVSIRTIPDSAMAVHPFGVLSFSERIVPLDTEITKFGNKLPLDAKRFEIEVANDKLVTTESRESFAPANFFSLKDAEKLARPSFETMKSGFKIIGSSELKAPPLVATKNVDYEFSYLGQARKPKRPRYHIPGLVFKAGTKSAAAAKSPGSYQNNRVSLNAPEQVTIQKEKYVVANTSNMKLHSSALVADTYTEALEKYNTLISTNPSLVDQVQVLSGYELVND